MPDRPTELELAGSVAVAAQLGDLTYRMVISGTTDLEMLDRLEAEETLHERLIVIGRPEPNRMILRLNQLGVFPVPLRERQLAAALGDAASGSQPGTGNSLWRTGTTTGLVTATATLATQPSGETGPAWLIPLVATTQSW